MSDASATATIRLSLKDPWKSFTNQQLWEAIVELTMENTELRKKLKRKNKPAKARKEK